MGWLGGVVLVDRLPQIFSHWMQWNTTHEWKSRCLGAKMILLARHPRVSVCPDTVIEHFSGTNMTAIIHSQSRVAKLSRC